MYKTPILLCHEKKLQFFPTYKYLKINYLQTILKKIKKKFKKNLFCTFFILNLYYQNETIII